MKRAILSVLTLVVLIVGAAFVYRSIAAGGKKEEIQYRIAEVKKDTVKKTVTATGVLKPWTTVDIKSRAGGRIDKMYVDDGSEVKPGQLLAEIDPSDTLLSYSTAQADIAANKARIDQSTKEYSLQQQQTVVALQTAEANLASAKAASASSYARYKSAEESAKASQELSDATIANSKATLEAETARLDQLTNATQPQQSAQALASYNQAMANLKNAELQLNRQKALLAKGYVAASAVDQAQATYDVARATVASAKEVTNTISPQLLSDLKAQQARVAQARASLRTAEANQVDIQLKYQQAQAAKADYEQSLAAIKTSEANYRRVLAERMRDGIQKTMVKQSEAQIARSKASLKNAEVQLRDTKITAPSEGVILKKYVEQGTMVASGMSFNSAGTAIFALGDTTRMYVEVQVDETDVASVEPDQKVDITFDAYPTTPFEGKVIKVDPQATVEQNVTTIKVRVEVDNTAPTYRLLKPGMNASCEFISAKLEDVVAVPNEALKTDEEGKRYVELPQGGKVAPAEKDEDKDPNLMVGVTITRRFVEIGLEGNDLTEIKDGLKEGEKIITQTLEPTPLNPMSNPFGGGKGPGRGMR